MAAVGGGAAAAAREAMERHLPVPMFKLLAVYAPRPPHPRRKMHPQSVRFWVYGTIACRLRLSHPL